MKPIYRGSRLPRRGYLLDGPAWLYVCPACSYEWATHDRDGAVAVARTHCITAGGTDHDRVLADVLAAESPLFREWVA